MSLLLCCECGASIGVTGWLVWSPCLCTVVVLAVACVCVFVDGGSRDCMYIVGVGLWCLGNF